MNRRINFSVYLVTDRPLCMGRNLEDVVEQAVRGGVGVVQLREKLAPTREFVEIGRSLLAMLQPNGIPLIINDRVDVALAIGADGVHVGQSDMAYEDARRLLGRDAVIGLSVENLEHVRRADKLEGLDYMGVSPIYPTDTKKDTAPAMGLAGLTQARGLTSLPLVAIGGVNLDNAGEVIAAGADGVAVVSAICSAPEPEAATQALLGQVRAARTSTTG